MTRVLTWTCHLDGCHTANEPQTAPGDAGRAFRRHYATEHQPGGGAPSTAPSTPVHDPRPPARRRR